MAYIQAPVNIKQHIVETGDTQFKMEMNIYTRILCFFVKGQTSLGGGSLPVTALKPDIVNLDTHRNNLHLFEMICPAKIH